MQDFISLVDDQLYLEEITPHRHDYHDPPHAAGVGDHDDELEGGRAGWDGGDVAQLVGEGAAAAGDGYDLVV